MFLYTLAKIIKKRKTSNPKISYTSSLLKKSLYENKKKFMEEIKEFLNALNYKKKNIVHEAGDVLYHLLVLLEKKKINLKLVILELKKRSKISGFEEKKNRKNVRQK